MQADDDDFYKNINWEDEEAYSRLVLLRLKKQREKKRKPIDRQAAFLEFKSQPDGKEIEEQIISNRQDLKDKKQKVKVVTDLCNITKKEIDIVK